MIMGAQKLANRISSTAANPIAIRGASTRPALLRTGKTATGGAVRVSNRVNTLDVWREFVQARYNAEAGFLNLEVSVVIECEVSPLNSDNDGQRAGRR